MAYWLGDTCKNCGNGVKALVNSASDVNLRWTHNDGEWRCPSPGVATPKRMN